MGPSPSLQACKILHENDSNGLQYVAKMERKERGHLMPETKAAAPSTHTCTLHTSRRPPGPSLWAHGKVTGRSPDARPGAVTKTSRTGSGHSSVSLFPLWKQFSWLVLIQEIGEERLVPSHGSGIGVEKRGSTESWEPRRPKSADATPRPTL